MTTTTAKNHRPPDPRQLLREARELMRQLEEAEIREQRADLSAREARKIADRRRLELGQHLCIARKQWPARGPKARGWGEFLGAAKISQQTAGRLMALAGYVEEHGLVTDPSGEQRVPTLVEAGVVERPQLSLVPPSDDDDRQGVEIDYGDGEFVDSLNARAALAAAGSGDWGTPEIARTLCAVGLGAVHPSAPAIDLDGSSSTYWNAQWDSRARPREILDGSPGRDLYAPADVDAVIARLSRARGGGAITVFENADGNAIDDSVRNAWTVLESRHRRGQIESLAWVGFSSEQPYTLIPEQPDDEMLHPFHRRACTIFPRRRLEFLAHPAAMLAMIERRLAKVPTDARALERARAALESRTNDDPVPGPAPTHHSYVTFLWSPNAITRKRQQVAVRRFLDEQSEIEGSKFERCAVIGEW